MAKKHPDKTSAHQSDPEALDENIQQDSMSKWRKIAEEAEQQEQEELGTQPAAMMDDASDEEPISSIEYEERNKLRDLLNMVENERNELKNQLARSQAELDNVRRRAERDVSNAYKYSTDKLILALLPVADSLIRGMEGLEGDENPKVQAVLEGMRLTLDILHNVLGKSGVEIIDPQSGDPFDPQMHEAMSIQQDPQAKPDTVLSTLQKGYLLNGRVLRAAMVVVNK